MHFQLLSMYVRVDQCGRGKAFVDILVGSFRLSTQLLGSYSTATG